MSGRHLRTRRSRIHVELPVWASTRQSRELSAFARYCVARIERELGELSRWTVSTQPDARGGFSATVVAYHETTAAFTGSIVSINIKETSCHFSVSSSPVAVYRVRGNPFSSNESLYASHTTEKRQVRMCMHAKACVR